MVIKSIPINKKTNLSPETQTDQIKNLLQIAIREKAEYPKRDRDMVNLMEDMHRGNYSQTIHRLKLMIKRQRNITSAAHDELIALMGEL